MKSLGSDVPVELYVYADALTGECTMSRYPGRKPRVYNQDTVSRCVEYVERVIKWIREVAKDPK